MLELKLPWLLLCMLNIIVGKKEKKKDKGSREPPVRQKTAFSNRRKVQIPSSRSELHKRQPLWNNRYKGWKSMQFVVGCSNYERKATVII